eukprot:symbB.v1.2.030877.t1/scaffold3524.1/size54796/2
MFDFDELDATLPANSKTSIPAPEPVVPVTAVSVAAVQESVDHGPPSLESLMEEDSEAEPSTPKVTVADVPVEPVVSKPVERKEPKVEHKVERKETFSRQRLKSPNLRRLHVPVAPPVRGFILPADEDLFMWMAQKLDMKNYLENIGKSSKHIFDFLPPKFEEEGNCHLIWLEVVPRTRSNKTWEMNVCFQVVQLRKCYLHQDMFLLGAPGSHLRQAVLRFAQQTGREVEYIGITRDTTEADLKQRREIVDGQLVFHNAPSVEAALKGRLLILEGLQKAERNVLPLLNNLLENREMSLEDGRLDCKTWMTRRLLPVSPNFLVVAIGLPVPPYHGTALDPPLRSRFAAKRLEGDDEAVALGGPVARSAKLAAVVKMWRRGILVLRSCLVMSSESTGTGYCWMLGGVMLGALWHSIARIPSSPSPGPLVTLWPIQAARAQATALHRAYPWSILQLSPSQRTALQSALKLHGLELPGTDAKQGYSLGGVEMQAEHFARMLFREGQNELQVCYLVCNAMPCHSTTLDSRAALEGGLAILDGIHRLPLGALTGALSQLLLDRAATLPDGTKMVPEEQWTTWLQQGFADSILRQQGFRPVHRAFRVLATAEPPEEGRPWLEDEVLTLFHFAEVKPLPATQQLKLVSELCGLPAEHPVLAGLMAYGKSLRAAAKSDVSLQPLVLSMRQLLQLARRCQARPKQTQEVVQAALHNSTVQSSMRSIQPHLATSVGLQVDFETPKELQEARRRSQVAEDRGERLKALEEPAIGLRFMANPQAQKQIEEETQALQEEASLYRQRAREEVQRRAREALRAKRSTTTLELSEELRIGDVSCKRGKPERPELADKAPLEVVCILKSLAEDGEFALGDGRTIMKPERIPKASEGVLKGALLPIAPGFRMIVLANRPGYPFLGNDFYRECGDVFASQAVENPDVVSEVELLRSYGPNVPQEQLVSLLGLFVELRRLVEEGLLAYPYSTRELVKIVRHLESFPDDPVEEVFADIFEFDWHDPKLRETLGRVLQGCGFRFEGPKEVKHGDAKRRLPKELLGCNRWTYDVTLAGNWDGRQHIGEGPWDGGSGGTGTAGIGGRAGPYRLDVGQELVMLTEEQKKEVPEEWHKKAQQMADEAYAHRLKELQMSGHDEQEYGRLRQAVEAQISAFQLVLQSHEARHVLVDTSEAREFTGEEGAQVEVVRELLAKERERTWQKQQVQGELDEMRIVDGIAGARNIYRRRGDAEEAGGDQLLPKRIKFVMDCSSMYTFNRIDQRLQRLMEASIFIFESFAGLDHKYEYSMVGHSGSGPEAENLIPWGKPPRSPKEQLAIVKQMAAHAPLDSQHAFLRFCSKQVHHCHVQYTNLQYSHSGDHTLQATDRAIKDVVRKAGDEYYVFVVSDADLGRYGISPAAWNKILMQDKRVNAYVILISSNTDEAETIKSGLTPGHGFVCDHNDLLAVTFKQVILVASNAKAGSAKGTIRPELLKGQTEDPTMDWVTMGYPQLAQASGKYYFEVNLIEGAEAPQVGLLSKDFKPQPGVASTQGVGDCENGWAVDGQNAIRWHRGEALPWNQTWPSTENTRKLSQMVTVGVAMDLDNRCIYFSTDGKWEENWLENPAFSKDRIPAGVEVFPAISLKGRASFDFGPYWKYKPPIRKGHKTNFNVWRLASPGVHRVDVPQIGNSEMLSIYKEVQLHGELSLHLARMASHVTSTVGVHQLNFGKSAEEIRSGLHSLMERYEAQIQEIVKANQATQVASFEAFSKLADADGQAALMSAELTLPALVSGDVLVRKAAQEAKKALQLMWGKSYAYPDLYEVLVKAQSFAKTPEEERLSQVVLSKFRHVGAHLPEKQRHELEELDGRCSTLCFTAEQNINEDCSSVVLSVDELEGCAETFIQSLPDDAGMKRCSLKAPVLVPILQRCRNSETRRKIMEASQQRCMELNGPILEELLTKRHAAAVTLGFSCHAERMLAVKMAGSLDSARNFVLEMLQRMQPLRERDLQRMGKRKNKDLSSGKDDNGADATRKRKAEALNEHGLDAWDVSFYGDLLKREELLLDDEKLKEFFPLEGTIERILEVYTELLGFQFEKNDQLPRWHEEVKAFEVKEDGKVVGHLFLDQFPRDGKFSHQMIVPLAPAFVSNSGEECLPACVNISNLPRSEGGRPALLRFSEMKTLFHELGHVMHCLCTRTRFSMLSWAWPMVPWPGGVEQDFLEVPSMALEKFACEPVLLQRVAKHFSGQGPKLEDKVISKIKELETWMAGLGESRYFASSLFDLMIHSQAPPYSFEGEEGLSSAELYRRVMQKYTTLAQLPKTNYSASWYHLYIGYDAGVYGYGWSDVFAADLFHSMRISQEGALSSATGQRLRKEILAPCATKSGDEMLKNFLGREPSVEAWCKTVQRMIQQMLLGCNFSPSTRARGLKRNVQRLVAARKYRDMNKMQRSFGLRVSKAGECGGSYKRVGARCDMPMYRCGNGSVLYYDGLSNHWRMALKTGSEEEQFADKAVYCSVPAVLNATEPPRSGWKLPDEERGLLPKASFMKGLDAKGVSPEVIQSLVLKMVHQDSEGKVSAFRRKGGVSFDAEWAKLEDPPCEAQAAWQSCVDQLQENLMNEFGVPGSHVVESAHPYEAKGFRWTKEVCIKGAAALMVNFYEKSCTYDSNTRLCIFSGGLPRDTAGPGARVELHTCCSQRVWGTVAERVEGNWKVLLDRQPPGTTSVPTEEWPRIGDQAQAKHLYGMWYACKIAGIKEEGGMKIYTVEWDDGDFRDKEKLRDEIQPRGGGPVPELAAARNVEDVEIYRNAAPKDGTVQCFAYCKEAPPKRVLVKYSKQEGPKYDEQGFGVTCGDELLVFSLDRTCPLTPIVLSKIADKPGPAKVQGVESGWYLDLVKTFSGPHREALGELLNGRLGGLTLDLCPVKPDQVMQAVMSNLDNFVQLLNTKVRAMDDVTLCFINSSSAVVPVLLPEVQVQYDAPVGSEIEILGHDGKTDVVVKSFTKEGDCFQGSEMAFSEGK